MEYPECLSEVMDSLVNYVKPKKDILDKVEIPFIEKTFTSKTDKEVREILDKSCQCEIPDGLINTLSSRIYAKSFNEMSVSEQSIINVLAVYLMIQNYNLGRNSSC
jgi:protoporphyrinogen oxidase